MAAGWPDDQGGSGYYEYWTGQVDFDTYSGTFGPDEVRLAYGYVSWYGDPALANPVVACVPSIP
jgi:hypothetical protein